MELEARLNKNKALQSFFGLVNLEIKNILEGVSVIKQFVNLGKIDDRKRLIQESFEGFFSFYVHYLFASSR